MKGLSRLALATLVAASWSLTLPLVYSSSSLVGFTSTSYALPGGIVIASSPTLADLTGDGVPEILVGTTAQNGASGGFDRPIYLVAMRGNGSPWFQINVGAPINSSPAVGDIDGDGDPEVVVSVGGDVADLDHHGGVVAYNRFGQFEWFFSSQDHSSSQDGWREGVFSSPLLCDVDDDGDMEIAFGSWDQRIYLLDHNGNSLWDHPVFDDPVAPGPGFYNADTIWSSAVCADLDHDGYKEIIIGADIASGGVLPDGTRPSNGGYLYVFDKDGDLLVRRYVPEVIYSSPAVGDLDGDGELEIVVGTGYFYWERQNPHPQPYVYAFDASDVSNSSLHYSDPAKLPDLPGWPRPTAYPGFSSPALADLDGNGDLEVIIGSGTPYGVSDPYQCSGSASDPDCYGAIYAWHHDGTSVNGFPMWPKDYMNKNSFVRSSPTVADIDGDGQLEILFAMLWDVIVVGPNGAQEHNHHTTWTVIASPAIGDTDDDEKVEVWIGGSKYGDQSKGYLWRFESDTVGIGKAPWPMFHRDARNTGSYAPPRLNARPDSLYVMHDYGSGTVENRSVLVANKGDGEIVWEVCGCPSEVSVDPSFGETDWGGQIADISISTSGYVTGTYDLGKITLVGAVDGEEVEGSPFEIPVTIYVGRVYSVFLPVVLNGGT